MIAKAKLLGCGFYCNTLAGKSNYNISINADMTVSCNCHDRNGTAKIGDLRTQNFSEIFSGKIATNFRRQLSRGVLPIDWCVSCFELKMVDKREAAQQITVFNNPEHIMVENTSVCNLACTSCSRVIYDRTRQKKWLEPADIVKVALEAQTLGLKSISFNKLGEPFLSMRINDEVTTILKYNPDLEIRCHTAGLAMNTPEKLEAALKMKHLYVSIHGISTKMCNRYQHGQDFDKAFANMVELVKLRNERGKLFPVVIWMYVVFRWNDRAAYLNYAHQLCKQHGIDYLLLAPAISPPGAWSWRFKFNRPFKGASRWEVGIGGLVVPACATESHDQYIRNL